MVITLFQVAILYNQFLVDRDSCSDIVGYYYDVAPRQIYKNWQGKLAQLLIYSPGWTLVKTPLIHRISLLLHLG